MNATPLYLAIIAEVRKQIAARAWTMWKCDERSGVQDGYTAKMLHPNAPSGRQARWPTLQDTMDALYPDGVTVRVRALDGAGVIAMHHWEKLQASLDLWFPHGIEVEISPAMHKHVSMGDLMRIGSRDGGRQMAAHRRNTMPPWRRSRIAKNAAKARWAKARAQRQEG